MLASVRTVCSRVVVAGARARTMSSRVYAGRNKDPVGVLHTFGKGGNGQLGHADSKQYVLLSHSFAKKQETDFSFRYFFF
jgi:hypothetical protein